MVKSYAGYQWVMTFCQFITENISGKLFYRIIDKTKMIIVSVGICNIHPFLYKNKAFIEKNYKNNLIFGATDVIIVYLIII